MLLPQARFQLYHRCVRAAAARPHFATAHVMATWLGAEVLTMQKLEFAGKLIYASVRSRCVCCFISYCDAARKTCCCGVVQQVAALFVVISVDLAWNHAEEHVIAWFIAGIFTLVAVPMSFLDMFAHLLHYSQPSLQRYVIRILLMVRVQRFCAAWPCLPCTPSDLT